MPIWLKRPAVSLATLVAALLLISAARVGAQQVPHVLVVGPLEDYGAVIAGLWKGLQSGGFTDISRVHLDVQNVHSAARSSS
jgi:hypothetical protein